MMHALKIAAALSLVVALLAYVGACLEADEPRWYHVPGMLLAAVVVLSMVGLAAFGLYLVLSDMVTYACGLLAG